jgi:hypothetical protein
MSSFLNQGQREAAYYATRTAVRFARLSVQLTETQQ